MSQSEWSVPRLWPGSTIVILAGGTSLDLAQVRQVAMARLEPRCRVIAVNDAIYAAWWADLLYAADYGWWNVHRTTATKFKGIKVSCCETVPAQWGVKWLICDPNSEGLSPKPSQTHGGGNGGYQACNIAYHLGAARILLLGFDMHDGGGKVHWHGRHEDLNNPDAVNYGSWLAAYPALARDLKAKGVEVINCSPGSALDCFPKARLEEVL